MLSNLVAVDNDEILTHIVGNLICFEYVTLQQWETHYYGWPLWKVNNFFFFSI